MRKKGLKNDELTGLNDVRNHFIFPFGKKGIGCLPFYKIKEFEREVGMFEHEGATLLFVVLKYHNLIGELFFAHTQIIPCFLSLSSGKGTKADKVMLDFFIF